MTYFISMEGDNSGRGDVYLLLLGEDRHWEFSLHIIVGSVLELFLPFLIRLRVLCVPLPDSGMVRYVPFESVLNCHSSLLL